jgi:hypothetical protein
MKISKSALILSGAAVGLTLVYCEQGTNCVPTKAQLILRQKIADLNGTGSSRSQAQELADVERLHKEGKINDEQFEALKKKINEQYAGSLTPEARANAQQELEKKIAELNAAPKPTPSNSEVQAHAEQALQQKLHETPAAAAARPETSAVSQQLVQQKIAEARTQEKANLVPAPAGGALSPDSDAKARELLRMKIAETRSNDQISPAPSPAAQTKAVAVLHDSGADAKAGITPETPEQTRILRLKIAESRGTITPSEAAQAIATPATHTAATATAAGASPVTYQTSNKTGLARLNELTELYKADKVTPYEYHHERAKIVATL